jgi:hypothetical protein
MPCLTSAGHTFHVACPPQIDPAKAGAAASSRGWLLDGGIGRPAFGSLAVRASKNVGAIDVEWVAALGVADRT